LSDVELRSVIGGNLKAALVVPFGPVIDLPVDGGGPEN
jgi:hypothetical protein